MLINKSNSTLRDLTIKSTKTENYNNNLKISDEGSNPIEKLTGINIINVSIEGGKGLDIYKSSVELDGVNVSGSLGASIAVSDGSDVKIASTTTTNGAWGSLGVMYKNGYSTSSVSILDGNNFEEGVLYEEGYTNQGSNQIAGLNGWDSYVNERDQLIWVRELPQGAYISSDGVQKGYATINAAIDVAKEGETILVAPGTYNENLNEIKVAGLILRSLTGAEDTIITAGIELRADNVTVDGFTFGSSETKDGYIGLQGTNGATILNNIVNGKKATVSIGNTTGNTVDSVTIEGNTINGGTIGLYPTSGSTITISNNTINSGNGEIIWIHGAGQNSTSLILDIQGNIAIQEEDVITIHFKPVSINEVVDELEMISTIENDNEPVEVVLGWVKTVGATDADFTTIQEAIVAAADGDTILVGPGKFNEDITINKSIKLYGANAGINPNNSDWTGAERDEETIFTGVITASAGVKNIEIDGFEFTKAEGGIGGVLDFRLGGHKSIKVVNNIANETFADSAHGGSGFMYVTSHGGHGPSERVEFVNNRLIDTHGSNTAGTSGVLIWSTNNIKANGNYFYRTNNTTGMSSSAALNLLGQDGTMEIQDNYFEDMLIKLDGTNFVADAITGNVFTGRAGKSNILEFTTIRTLEEIEFLAENNTYSLEGLGYVAYGRPVRIGDTGYTTMQAAIEAAKAGDTILVEAGTYKLNSASNKDITIIGAKETIIDITEGCYMDSGKIAFEGVTIKGGVGYATNGGGDLAALYSPNVTHTNCYFDGGFHVGRDGAKFVGCTFDLTASSNTGVNYVWTLGNDVTFENCIFNTDGKALLIYSHGGDEVATVSITGCTFNATKGDKAYHIANQDCAAIEIDNFGNGVDLTTSDNIIGENFSGEWRIKNYVANGDKVEVNSVEYTTIAIDGKTMTIDENRNVTVIK